MEKIYNVAIVGFGGMGNWHREIIEKIDGIKVCGTYDIKEERQQFAQKLGITPYNSFEDLLADKKIDIVLCSTPNDAHKEIVTRSLYAGKNVVCEKPVTLNSKDLNDMINVSKETGKLFTVHQNRRWDEDYLTAKKIYEENILGNIFRIESRVHGSRGIPGDWRQEPEHGGGMVLDWGVHILDQALMMIPYRVKSVFAILTHITNEIVDDGFTILLTFENGLEYLLEVGTSNFISLPRWYILGQDGTAVIKNWALSGEIVRVKDWEKKDAIPVRTAAGLTKTMAPRTKETIRTEPLPVVKSDIREFYKNVMATIEGKEEIIVKLPEVMRNMKLMEKVFKAAKERQILTFE